MLVFMFMAGMALSAAGLVCSNCRKTINGNYLKTPDGKVFCSQKCYEQTLPRCKVCGKVLSGQSIKSGNDYYCSQECFSSQLPVCQGCGRHSGRGMVFKSGKDVFYCEECAQLPKCFSCMLPAVGGSALEDGRSICGKCTKDAVNDQDQAEKIFNAVRELMKTKFDICTGHRIKLRMVDLPSMQRRSPDYAPGMEMGLFVYDATINTVQKETVTLSGIKEETQTFRSNVSYTIFFLKGTPAHKLVEVFSHELGHDWMQEYYPSVTDLKIKEGFSEYCAYMVNKSYHQESMNQRIKNNPDPIYGDGFRTIYKIGGENGDFSAIRRFLRQHSK